MAPSAAKLYKLVQTNPGDSVQGEIPIPPHLRQLLRSKLTTIHAMPEWPKIPHSRRLNVPAALWDKKCSSYYTTQPDSEPNTSIYEIPLVTPSLRAFKIFLYWLYTDELPSVVHADDDEKEEEDEIVRSTLRDFLDTWVLFGTLKLPQQQNLVMDRLCSLVQAGRHNPSVALLLPVDTQFIAQKPSNQLLTFLKTLLAILVYNSAVDANTVLGVLQAAGLGAHADFLQFRSTPAADAAEESELYGKTYISDWCKGIKTYAHGLGVAEQ